MMMNSNNIKFFWLLSVGLLLIVFSCKHKEEKYHSVSDRIEAKSKNYKGIAISSDKYTTDLQTQKITENGITFLILNRKEAIKSYKCSECHTEPLSKLQGKDVKKAHWNIKLNHAEDHVMNCLTCHNGKDMDHLKSLTAKPIDFDTSYKLCSQCHQKQFKDWTGGAHGKRVQSWASPRVSMTCVNCHNPHKPHFYSKFPARFNTQKVKERK